MDCLLCQRKVLGSSPGKAAYFSHPITFRAQHVTVTALFGQTQMYLMSLWYTHSIWVLKFELAGICHGPHLVFSFLLRKLKKLNVPATFLIHKKLIKICWPYIRFIEKYTQHKCFGLFRRDWRWTLSDREMALYNRIFSEVIKTIQANKYKVAEFGMSSIK